MDAQIINLESRREFDALHPHMPSDLSARDDGSWDCSRETRVRLTRWFNRFGLEFNPACKFEDLAEQLHFVLRAAALLPRLDDPTAAPAISTPYWTYLNEVKRGDLKRARAAREMTLQIRRAKGRSWVQV